MDINNVKNPSEVARHLGRDAKELGISPQELAQRMVDEYVAAHTDKTIKGVDGSEHPIGLDAEEFKPTSKVHTGSARLPKADRKGDFFYHDSNTWGYNHGHNGLYRWRGTVVEAANDDLGVIKTRIINKRTGEVQRKVPKGTFVLQRSGVSRADRDSITSWANHRVGADYRSWWKPNRKKTGPFNCSQLIWAAYKEAGFELDPDSDSRGTWNIIVYPSELATAKNVYYYKRAGM